MQQIISDPMSVVENIGQTVFDAAEDEGIMYVTGVGLTTFVPVVGQVGKGAKGVSTLKAISKGSNKNVPTEVFKGTPYSKDFIKQKVTITKTALGKQKVPVFYKEKLATDSVNITTFGMEMKPLSEVNPQMFSVKGAKGTGNKSKIDIGKTDIDVLRKKWNVPETETVAVGKTDVKGLENLTFEGGSPKVRKEAGLPDLDEVMPNRSRK